MENHTAKNFVLQLGSLITLYLSLTFLLVLLFSIINIKFPDAIEGYYQIESANESIRLGVAMLVVFFPAYLILTRRVNNLRRQDTGSVYSGLTKWLVYLSLLVGGGVLLGDLVAVILGFLNGELTTRFVLKAGVLFVIVGAAFYYYLQDAKGYWVDHERASVTFGRGMFFVVLFSLVIGLFNIDTPQIVREMKIDEKQVQGLQDIQWRIEDYIRQNEVLPDTIEELYVTGVKVQTAPEDREKYEYNITENGFELCATFLHSTESNDNSMVRPYYPDENTIIKNPHNWEHGEGEVCFDRIVN
jgi:hypothetical protein